jgi:hypothetical protein
MTTKLSTPVTVTGEFVPVEQAEVGLHMTCGRIIDVTR